MLHVISFSTNIQGKCLLSLKVVKIDQGCSSSEVKFIEKLSARAAGVVIVLHKCSKPELSPSLLCLLKIICLQEMVREKVS